MSNNQPKTIQFEENTLASQMMSPGSQQPTLDKLTTDELMAIIRVQSRIKGWINRRKFKVQQLNNINTNKYFKPDEANETLTGEMFNPSADIETRSHTYKTGSVYEGEWKGGMRHGKGKMTWADGATYEGDWQYN